MRPSIEDEFRGITLAPCQVCRQLKNKFYICARNHTTCDDCKQIRERAPPRPAPVTHTRASPVDKRKQSVSPLTTESARTSSQLFRNQTSENRLSPSSAASMFGDDPRTSREATSPSKISSRRSRSPSNDPPSIFSSRSPIKSLVTIPKPDRVIIGECARGSEDFSPVESRTSQSRDTRSPPRIVEEDCSQGEPKEEIFCRSCGDFVEVIPMTLPRRIIESSASKCLDSIEPAEVEDVEKYSQESADSEDLETATLTPMTSLEGLDGQSLRRDVDKLRDGLLTTYSELMTAKSDLDEVIYATEKLEMDVDMMRGGVNYVYFNFDSILKRPEVRQEERICGIPFVLMVRLRNVAGVPHLGFFVGLEPKEGRAHSPLKKIIVLRAHNAYGKVIEKLTMRTFEDGQVAHLCFDLRKRQDGGMYGYSSFVKKDRILKPDMLKEGRLCLSLQIKPLL